MSGGGVRGRIVVTVFVKELREILRDRKTIFLLVAVPLLFYPMLLLLITEVAVAQKEKIEQEHAVVAVVGEALPALVSAALSDKGTVLQSYAEGEAQRALEAGEVQAVVEVPTGLSASASGVGTLTVVVRYSSVQPLSADVRCRIQDALDAWAGEVKAARLSTRELTPAFVEPVAVKAEDVAPPSRQAGSLLSMILPMLVLVFMIAGAFYPAVDLTAGERERKTIQTLLTAPVRPLEIVAGKYLTVLAVALASGVINIASMGLVLGHSLTVAGGEGGLMQGVSVSGWDIAALTFVVVLMGVMLSAVLMTIAAFAETPKNAQSYLSLVYMLCLTPVALSQIPGVEISATTAFIPVVNLALVMKEILVEGADLQSLFLVSLSTVLTTVVALGIAARVYTRTSLLVQAATARGFFSRSGEGGGRPSPVATPDEALAFVAVLFLLLYYVGSLVQTWDLLWGLLATLVGLLLVPTLGLIKVLKLDLRKTLHLRGARWPMFVGAALMGVSSLVWVQAATSLFHETFLPIPQPFIDAMESAFTMPTDPLGHLAAVGVMALAPAVCEESVFRGLLLSSFRGKVPGWLAVLVTAVLFGLFHLSVFRFLGTFALGLVMALMVWRSGSIWPSVLFHFLNNATALHLGDLAAALGLSPEEGIPMWLLGASVAVSAVGFGVLFLARPVWEEASQSEEAPA